MKVVQQEQIDKMHPLLRQVIEEEQKPNKRTFKRRNRMKNRGKQRQQLKKRLARTEAKSDADRLSDKDYKYYGEDTESSVASLPTKREKASNQKKAWNEWYHGLIEQSKCSETAAAQLEKYRARKRLEQRNHRLTNKKVLKVALDSRLDSEADLIKLRTKQTKTESKVNLLRETIKKLKADHKEELKEQVEKEKDKLLDARKLYYA